MAEQDQLSLPVAQTDILSDEVSSDQFEVGACGPIPTGSFEDKKKTPRRGKRGKSKKLADGINDSSTTSSNTDDKLFSLSTTAQINGAFAQLCVDPQTGEVNIPHEFKESLVKPGDKSGRKRAKHKLKKLSTLTENVAVGGLPKVSELHQSVIPLPIDSTSQNVNPNIIGMDTVKKNPQIPVNPITDIDNISSMLSRIAGLGLNTLAGCAQSSAIPTPIDETLTPNKKSKKKKRTSSSKNVTPSVETGSSPRTPNAAQSPRRQGRRSYGTGAREEQFSEYLPEKIVQVGLEAKRLIEGSIRINPKSYTEAYMSDPEKGQDILIEGIKNRNRALEGDEVVIQLNEVSEWKRQAKDVVQKTATVVFIRNKVHPRVAMGFIKPMTDMNPDVVLFSPRDARVPRIRIPISSCPDGFMKDYKKFDKMLFLASITDWTDTKFATGIITKLIGPLGDLEAENTAILLENDLNTEPYKPEMYSFFPPGEYVLTEEDFKNREDFRKECIFTIDPATARDLDDAMSCKELPNGNVEIGVHISDVSYFVKEGTVFDKEVAERATSTYLVDTVYHMLPRELCMLCSLLPGADKLAYSVFWEMDSQANVISHRFTRSVINSCVQLSYEHAQEMVENPSKKWTVDELPPIHGGFTVYNLSRVVNHLHRLAVIMRGRRFEGGALRIDQPKLCFSLDRATGRPIGYQCYVNKESHRLIEEFMLLANMTVAKRIYEDFPRYAFLRSHLPPHPYLMDQLRSMMESYGIHLDVSSAGALQKTMKNYEGEDFPSQARMMVLYARCAKPMARAKYFCTSGVDEEDFFHYALNVPLYTHFTSPIRRYPDIMVHRLLSASLEYCEPPEWIPDEVQKIASNCNKKKFDAKRAGEQSTELYLALYVGQLGQMLESAVVIDVKDRSFDVIVCDLGINQRIYTNKLPAEVKHIHRDTTSTLEITWLPTEDVPHTTLQTIEMFSIVTVLLTKTPGLLKVEAELKRPSISGNSFNLVKI